MNTSTPVVNKKLYGYLKGYETACFTGSDLATVTSSIHSLVKDEIQTIFMDQQYSHERLDHILSNVDKFFIRYYDRMRNLKTPAKVKLLADKSKEDKNNLDSMLSQLMGTEHCTLDTVAFMALSKNADPMDLCETCPWYCSHKFCLIMVYDQIEDAIIHQVSFQVAEYKYLALALIQMANFLVTQFGVKVSNFSRYYTLFTDILTCSHIYELMNPSGEAREEYLIDALTMLTTPHIPYNTEEYLYYDNLLSEVFQDIQSGKLPYIQEFRNALVNSLRDLHSPFDEERDYYYSMKGTGQSGYTREKHSLQSSAFETDPHLRDPRVTDFDNYIGYQSKYCKVGEDILKDITSIRTIGINNPGKFKIRIIHIADNALQDRCNWIHRRLMKLVNMIPSDCTKNQDSGREFLRKLTHEWYLQYQSDEKIGIYVTDFSNATDTVDQRFTHRILEFIFSSSEIANFWDYVSTLNKEFVHADGRKETYYQQTGQPQGLLASFLIFALCHHFLFLMDMKEMGLTNYRASQFYNVLGDDAVFTTIQPEKNFIDRDDPLYDQSGLPRSDIEMAHFSKCQLYAGFKINYDKSESAHWWSDEAKLDFAKVTYRNGSLFSPIPFRLAMKYNKSFDDKLAVSIWRADRSDKLANRLLDIQINQLPIEKQDDYRNLIRCGELPFLSGFEDHQGRPDDYINRVRFALAVSLLNSGLAFTISGDRERSNGQFDQYDRAMKTIFTPAQRLRLDKIDINHKVMLLLERNAEIVQTLHEIYSNKEFDDQFLSMCLASFMGDQKEEVIWMIYEIASFVRLLRLASSNPNIGRDELNNNFPIIKPFKDIRNDINVISNKFITRGITKRPGESSYLFRQVFNLLTSLHQQLDLSFGESNSDNSESC